MAEITVTYSRMPGYPKESVSRSEIGVVDKFKCAWDDRITLAKELVGYVSGGVVHAPHVYDAGDDPLKFVYARSVETEPLGSITSAGEYESAVLIVHYGTLDYDVETPDQIQCVTYVTESLEPASIFTTLNKKGLYWAVAKAEPLEDADAPDEIIRLVDWCYTIHHVSYIPSFVWTHPGAINKYEVYSRELNKTFAVETLLCGNPSLRREVTSEGVTAWTITCRFTYRPETWNKFPKTAKDGVLSFETIYDSASEPKSFYDSADFGSIVL